MTDFPTLWHCGAAHERTALECPHCETLDRVVMRVADAPCPGCGIMWKPWCERWCVAGKMCDRHTGMPTIRHPLAPSPSESRATGRRYLRALEKRPVMASVEDARIQASHTAAAADDRDADGVAFHGAAVKSILAAAQVAALASDAGGGAQALTLSRVSVAKEIPAEMVALQLAALRNP